MYFVLYLVPVHLGREQAGGPRRTKEGQGGARRNQYQHGEYILEYTEYGVLHGVFTLVAYSKSLTTRY